MSDFRRSLMAQDAGGGGGTGGQLEYVETDGKSFFKTDIDLARAPYIVGSFYFADTPAGDSYKTDLQYAYSCDSDTNNDEMVAFRLQGKGGNWYYAWNWSSTYSRNLKHGSLSYSTDHGQVYISIKNSGANCYYSTNKTLSPSSITTSLNQYRTECKTYVSGKLMLMGCWMVQRWWPDTNPGIMHSGSRFYGFDIYTSSSFNTLSNSLRPWIKDGVVGIKDLKTEKFYAPYSYDGSGSMIPGPAV